MDMQTIIAGQLSETLPSDSSMCVHSEPIQGKLQ